MFIPDYHLHAQFSNDSTATVADYCHYASQIGLKEISITEHLTFYEGDKNFQDFDYVSYIKEIERCRQLFESKVEIKAGLEIDYHPYLEDKIKNKIAKWDKLDLIIGAVHYVEGRSVIKSKIEKENIKDFVEDYLKIMEKLIKSGLCDIIGHFDVFRRSTGETYQMELHLNTNTIKNILAKAANKNLALEINTSSFKHGLNDTFPCAEIVKLFKSCGGKYITIGSDAHHLEELATYQEKGIAVAKQAGFHKISCYKKRKPSLMSLQP